MSVPLGFVAGTLITTPDGPVPIEQLAEGDWVICVDPETDEPTPTRITAVHRGETRQLVRVDAPPVDLRGCAPGTSLYDAFEEIFRSAASLSSLSEMRRPDGTTATVVEVPERPGPAEALHLTVEAKVGTFFADEVLVRHKEVL